MTSSTDIGSIASSAHACGHARRRRKVATIALFPLACLLMLAPTRDGAAGEFSARDDSISALREYAEARQIATAETSSAAPARRFGAPEGAGASDRYMDLRDFAERIGAGGPPVVVAKGEKAKTVVKAEGEATYVGAQVCLGCHAAQ